MNAIISERLRNILNNPEKARNLLLKLSDSPFADISIDDHRYRVQFINYYGDAEDLDTAF